MTVDFKILTINGVKDIFDNVTKMTRITVRSLDKYSNKYQGDFTVDEMMDKNLIKTYFLSKHLEYLRNSDVIKNNFKIGDII